MASGAGDGRPGGRHKPTLRILLLLSLGLLVYFKYDDAVQSRWVERLRDPGALWQEARARLPGAPRQADPAAAPAFSSDSTALEWDCASPAADSCLSSWTLPEGERGTLRALLRKAEVRLDLAAGAGFRAEFARLAPEEAEDAGSGKSWPWRLERLMVRTGPRDVALAFVPVVAGRGAWCALDASGTPLPEACLADVQPVPPLEASVERLPERPPVAAFHGSPGRPFHPILPGQVVDLDAEGEWIKVHHGNGLFSYYAGAGAMGPRVKPGVSLEAGDTLGFTGNGRDTAPDTAGIAGIVIGESDGPLRLRVEKEGSPVDPLAFLGLDPTGDTTGATHAR